MPLFDGVQVHVRCLERKYAFVEVPKRVVHQTCNWLVVLFAELLNVIPVHFGSLQNE